MFKNVLIILLAFNFGGFAFAKEETSKVIIIPELNQKSKNSRRASRHPHATLAACAFSVAKVSWQTDMRQRSLPWGPSIIDDDMRSKDRHRAQTMFFDGTVEDPKVYLLTAETIYQTKGKFGIWNNPTYSTPSVHGSVRLGIASDANATNQTLLISPNDYPHNTSAYWVNTSNLSAANFPFESRSDILPTNALSTPSELSGAKNYMAFYLDATLLQYFNDIENAKVYWNHKEPFIDGDDLDKLKFAICDCDQAEGLTGPAKILRRIRSGKTKIFTNKGTEMGQVRQVTTTDLTCGAT